MTIPEQLGKLMVIAARTEGKVDALTTQMATHEEHDKERFAAAEVARQRNHSDIRALREADASSATMALTEAKAAAALASERSYDIRRTVGLMLLGALGSGLLGLALYALRSLATGQ